MRRKEFLAAVAGTIATSAMLPGMAAGELADARGHLPWPTIDPDDEKFWRFLRGQFPLTHDRVYLNTGGLGASPYAVIDAVKAKMDELEKVSETGRDEETWTGIKKSSSELLGCEPGEIALVRNTTEGVNIVANGLPLRRGDEVITTTHEHIGNSFPWLLLSKQAGFSLKLFEPSCDSAGENLDRIERLMTRKTRLVSVPHAATTTGLILPVKEIAEVARKHNCWFFIDGAQTAGMFPFNLHEIGCDAYATSGHKWLLGPKGTGLLYVRHDMLDTIRTKFVGAYSCNEFDWRKGVLTLNPDAQRYEYGTVSVPLAVGLGAAIGFVQKIGIGAVWKRDRMLSTRLYEGLKEIPGVTLLSPGDDSMRSAMITFMHAKLGFREMQEHLEKYRLRTRAVTEGGLSALRVSLHIYNTPDEVERVLEGVRSAGK
jgi:selenocysteine lyase/cysteine desulfurase